MMVVILLVIENMRLAAVGINQEMLPVFLFIMLTAAIAWIFLSNRLYTELRQNYPKLYETLGKPKFFMKKSLTTNFNVVRFIFKQNYKAALEPTVIRLCQGLRSLFLIYTICLAGCFVILLDKMGWI